MSEDNTPITGQSFGYDPIEVGPDRFIDWFEVSHIQWWGDGVEQDVRVDLHFVAAPDQTFVLRPSDAQQLAQCLKAAAASAFATLEAAKANGKLVTPSAVGLSTALPAPHAHEEGVDGPESAAPAT